MATHNESLMEDEDRYAGWPKVKPDNDRSARIENKIK